MYIKAMIRVPINIKYIIATAADLFIPLVNRYSIMGFNIYAINIPIAKGKTTALIFSL
jgi:hypothetical protein